jgi:coenzyme PQQ precursor peptide PqqA
MKFMRGDSWARGWPGGRPAATMGSLYQEDPTMKWQTPQAQDFRFGFEITMYIAAR